MNVPPKTVQQQIANKFPSIGDRRIQGSGLPPNQQAGSLPVLQAFQEFLDHERDRTRKRLLLVSLSYLGALVLIVAVCMTAGVVVVKRLQTDFDNVQKEVEKLKGAALKSRADTDTLSLRLSDETTKLRTDLSADDIKTKLLAQFASQEAKLTTMNSALEQLRKENSKLKDSFVGIESQLQAAATSQTQSAPNPATPPTLAEPHVLSVLVAPPGQNRLSELRIPIAE